MGAFSAAVEIFTMQGVGVIPTRQETPAVPMVKHPDRFGVPASRRLAADPRFADANAAIWAGSHSRLTIVDVDSSDPAHVAEAIKAFGDSPLKISTPSGGLHLYYRHAGEPRRIRPFGKSLPLDVLGSGVAVVPPSVRQAAGKKPAGTYRVLEGDLASLDDLPPLRPGSMPSSAARQVRCKQAVANTCLRDMREGDGRDIALFASARHMAMSCATEAELVEAVLAENSKMAEPLSIAVAHAKAASAWRYKIEGRLLIPGSRVALGSKDELLQCKDYPPAFLLLCYLRCSHAVGAAPFAVVPDGISHVLSLSPMTIRKARDWLLRVELLTLVCKGRAIERRRSSPNLYRLA
jgi:hypothetical protein